MSNLLIFNWKKVNVDDLVFYLIELLGYIFFFCFYWLCVGSLFKINFSVIVLYLIFLVGFNNFVFNIFVIE